MPKYVQGCSFFGHSEIANQLWTSTNVLSIYTGINCFKEKRIMLCMIKIAGFFKEHTGLIYKLYTGLLINLIKFEV